MDMDMDMEEAINILIELMGSEAEKDVKNKRLLQALKTVIDNYVFYVKLGSE